MATNFPVLSFNLLDYAVIRLLQCGPMPQHIAFIMDGNRRYGKKLESSANELDRSTSNGHYHGLVTGTEIWTLCHQLGIRNCSFYAFSIENFNRTSEEVNFLISLLKEHLANALSEMDQIMTNQVCFRFSGKMNLFPVELQQLIVKLTMLTAKNSRFYVNIFAPYTSREEILNAMATLQGHTTDGILRSGQIDPSIFSSSLYIPDLSEPDILVRTSGVSRLSDFQLWQCGFAHVAFVEKMWPELTRWDMYRIIFEYQRNYSSFVRYRRQYLNSMASKEEQQKIKSFFKQQVNLEQKRTVNCKKYRQLIQKERLSCMKSLL